MARRTTNPQSLDDNDTDSLGGSMDGGDAGEPVAAVPAPDAGDAPTLEPSPELEALAVPALGALVADEDPEAEALRAALAEAEKELADAEAALAELGDPIARMRDAAKGYADAVAAKDVLIAAADEKITQAALAKHQAEERCNRIELPLQSQLAAARDAAAARVKRCRARS